MHRNDRLKKNSSPLSSRFLGDFQFGPGLSLHTSSLETKKYLGEELITVLDRFQFCALLLFSSLLKFIFLYLPNSAQLGILKESNSTANESK